MSCRRLLQDSLFSLISKGKLLNVADNFSRKNSNLGKPFGHVFMQIIMYWHEASSKNFEASVSEISWVHITRSSEMNDCASKWWICSPNSFSHLGWCKSEKFVGECCKSPFLEDPLSIDDLQSVTGMTQLQSVRESDFHFMNDTFLHFFNILSRNIG